MSNSTEDVKAVINKILGYNMKGGDDSDSESSSSSSSSSISSSFEINNVNDNNDVNDDNNDSDDDVSNEQTEKNSNPASRPSKLSFSNSSDSDSKIEEKTESEFNNLISSSSGGSSSESSTDSVYEEKEDHDFKSSKRISEISDASKVTKDIEEMPVYKQKRLIPSNFINIVPNSRLQSNELQNLKDAVHQKFPHLTDTEKGNCETKIVMRHILREVNKQNDFGDDQDALIKAAYKYLDNMSESDINIEKFSEIDKAKDMSKKLFINMLYKIHKLAPELSHGDPRDGNVYDTIIVRSAAYRVAHEKYPDLPRLEFNQKVFDMLTPKFIKSVNIEEEKQRYEEYKNNKENNNSKPKAKKSTTKSKKSKK